MKLYIIWIFLLVGASRAYSIPDSATVAYVSACAPFAVLVHQETGVPASVILAQGILESNRGRSFLAQTANNHFGIKCSVRCKKKGHCVPRPEQGIVARYLAFESAEVAFCHLARILTSNRYSCFVGRFGDDYERWCDGLQAAGYATDKKYAWKLKKIIRRYGLDKYDKNGTKQGAHQKEWAAGLPLRLLLSR